MSPLALVCPLSFGQKGISLQQTSTLNFSSFFNVDHDQIESYGALDISLVNDLPLFIDPFLLFCSDKPEYQAIHRNIIRYIIFLKEQCAHRERLSNTLAKAWFSFPEVKQNWLGFSEDGNSGRGMGLDFAAGLFDGLRTVFADFGSEDMLESPHMEKFSLIRPKIGKDKISDFTANFSKEFLLEYTQAFAKQYIDDSKLETVNVDRVFFDYGMKRWMPKKYSLPMFNGDYVLLTPKDILTRDDTFINRFDMISSAYSFAPSIGNEALRFSFTEFINDVLSDEERKRKEKNEAIADFISKHPEIINYYLKFKEAQKSTAKKLSLEQVESVDQFFVDAAAAISEFMKGTTDFYDTQPSSFQAARTRILYLKNAIEKNDCYKLLWKNGEIPSHEADLQLMFKLVWIGTEYDVNREPNNGRGPVDYTVSKGSADKTIVEFKLAKNTKLKQNLMNQVEIYKNANYTNAAITVIVFYTESEQKRVEKIMNELGLAGNDHIILIDARKDNKQSASNVTA